MSLLPSAVRRLLLPVVALWLVAAVGVTWAPLLFSNGLVATYYDGPEWSGPALHTGLEHVGIGDWLAIRGPRLGRSSFSVSWRGWVAVASGTTFDIGVTDDAPVWLYVDDTEVISGTQTPENGMRRNSVALSRGLHRLQIDVKADDQAGLHVSWARAGNPLHEIGQEVLYPSRPAYYLAETAPPGVILAALASLGLLVLVASWGVHATSRHLATSGAEPHVRTWLWRVLALAAVLLAWQLWFGLPERWELDEVVPGDILYGARRNFSGGWYSHYPALYFGSLSVMSWPFMAGATMGAVELESAQSTLAQSVLYRLATALCAAAVVGLAYRVTFEAFDDRRAALWTGFLCAVTPLIVYLGKFAKPDLAYTVAFLAALVAYLRALRQPTPRHYQAFAFMGMTAICLKDQAYGLIVLPAAHLIWLRWRLSEGPPLTRLQRLAADPALWRAALTAVAVFAVGQNLIFNLDGFIGHVGLMMGGGSAGFRTYPATAGGQAAMLADGLRQVPWILGWPVALLVVPGLVLAWRQRRDATTALLLPIASYYLTFIAVIGYQYDRFYLAPAVLLTVPAGLALAWISSRPTTWTRVAVAAVAVFALAEGASVDLMMARDSRLAAETWLRTNVRDGQLVGMAGPRAYLPRPGYVTWTDVHLDWAEVDLAPPEFLVVNLEFAQRPRNRPFFDPLLAGTHPTYRPVVTFKSSPGLATLAYRDVFRNGVEDAFTNLDKINPEIRVFARNDVPIN